MSEKDEEILAEEELEVTAVTGGGAPIQIPQKVESIFPALAHRNYQLYFFGQGVSLIGFWLQAVAMGWVSFDLTHSPFYVGLVATAGGLPFLLFSTFAGVFIDKTDKQKLIVWTQILEAIIALVLGILVLTGTANITLLLITAFISGLVGAIDLPARQAFTVEMIGKKDLASAISINVGVFNGARFIGPALAGFLIASFGPGWAFILNAISFIPAIVAISSIKIVYKIKAAMDTHPWQSLKEGLSYSFTNNKLLYFMLLGGISAVFIWPYQTLMPVIAERVFNIGPSGLGSLLSFAGLGSLVGAIFTGAQTKKDRKKFFIFLGLFTATLSLILFSLSRNLLLSHILLFTTGFGFITFISTVNTLVQLFAPDQLRGRITAVYLTMFVGMMPVGSFLSGFIAERTSAVFTILIGGSIVFVVTCVLFLTKALDIVDS